MKIRFSEFLWPLGVGMLTGWVCLYLFLVFVLTHGGKIQGWHAAVWIVATFVGTMLVQGYKGARVEGFKGAGVQGLKGSRVEGLRGERVEGFKGLGVERFKGSKVEEGEIEKKPGQAGGDSLWSQIKVSLALTMLGLALPILFSWILSHFTDFSWDGMTSRGITVRNLMKGDPALDAYPFGHVLAGFLAHVTGSWQGGKGINLTLIWICFCFVFPALQSIGFAGWKLWFLSVVTTLNPVAVYQISCFQIDGHVASLVTCLIFSMVRILALGPIRPDGLLALIAAFTASAACKTSGVFYAIIVDGIFLLFLAGISRSWKRVLLLLAVALLVSWPLGIYIRSTGQFATINLDYLKSASSIQTENLGVGGGASAVQALKKFDKFQQFFASTMAMTESLPDDLKIKPPFWMTRRELRVFEELTPDPRAGGFGPQFGTALLLASTACLLLLFKGHAFYWPGWFVFLTAFGSSLGSQVWWARWTPQNWLILIAMVMTVLGLGLKGSRVQGSKGSRGDGEEGEEGLRVQGSKGARGGLEGVMEMGVKGLGGLACIATAINVFLVTLYYLVGMQRQEGVLNKQISIIRQLPSPLPIHIGVSTDAHSAGASFVGTEYLLTDRGVVVKKTPEPPTRPRMKLNKTATTFPLPPEWKLLLGNPKDEEIFRKRGLIED